MRRRSYQSAGFQAVVLAAAVIAMAGALAASAGARPPTLTPVGVLTAPANSGPGWPDGLAVSGQTLVTSDGSATVNGNQGQGALFVFSRPAAGWPAATSPAELTTTDGAEYDDLGGFSPPAVSGATIVAESDLRLPTSSVTRINVFEEPSGGWSGSVRQSAELFASAAAGCQTLGSAAILGGDVFAGCARAGGKQGQDPSGTMLVFDRPASGGANARRESAMLSAPSGRRLDIEAPTINGDTVFAASVGSSAFEDPGPPVAPATPSALYGFHRPASGWSGHVTPSSTLLLPKGTNVVSLASAGTHVFAASTAGIVYVFTMPRGGWRGTILPSAQLGDTPGDSFGAYPLPPTMAASGISVVLSTAALNLDKECPCDQELETFTEPERGWYGTVQATATATGVGDGPDLGLQGSTAFWTQGSYQGPPDLAPPDIALYDVPAARSPTSPAVRPDITATVSGLRDGQPRMTARVTAAAYQPLVRTLTLTAPRGMSFATGRGARAKGVSVTGAHGVTTAVSAQRLTMTTRSALSAATLVVRSPALGETAHLRALYRRTSDRHPLRLRFTLRVTDVTGHTSTHEIPVVIR